MSEQYVDISINGETLSTTVHGVKGKSCTNITAMFDQLNEQHAGKIEVHQQTSDYNQEEVVLEHQDA